MSKPTDRLAAELRDIARKIAAQPDIPKGIIDKDVVNEVTKIAKELEDIVPRLEKLQKAAYKAWGDMETALQEGLIKFIAENIERDPEYADQEIAYEDWSETEEYEAISAAREWCEALSRTLEGTDGYAHKLDSIQDHLQGFSDQIK